METQSGAPAVVKRAGWVWRLGYPLLMAGMSLWGDTPATEAPAPWRIGKESEVLLQGDSTVKTWECRTSKMEVELLIPFTPSQLGQALNAFKTSPQESLNNWTNQVDITNLPIKVKLSIQVEDLKSGNRKMERDLSNALNAAHHPRVLFELISLERISFLKKDPVFHTKGKLSMAGVTRELALDFRFREQREHAYFLDSQCTISMKDFGIDPPSGLFGLIKAHDEVTVIYRLQILYTQLQASDGK
jgi:polyisoprenoid-binding protein YceI